MFSQFSFAASGRRKHFLSHGPSVAAFGAGETVFSAYRDASVIQYNPSLMAFFPENALNVSRFNLYEGSSYNSGSLVIGLGKSFFIGASMSDLSSGNIEVRETIYSPERNISTNIWDYVISGAGMLESLGIAYGMNIKYLYYDLYLKSGGAPTVDVGIAKNIKGPKLLGSVSKFKLGLSAQNIISGDLKIDKEADNIPSIYRLSSAFIVPVYYRFKTQDTLSFYADLKYEDEFLDFYGGVAYTLADKYVARAGYYPQHYTFGFGIDFYMFTVDYSADFGELDLINRFGLTYKFGGKKENDELDKEAKDALNKEKLTLKEAAQKFKAAKKLYNKKEYLRATDLLALILVSYPKYESPEHFYKKVKEQMNITESSGEELDFSKLTYARGYCAYYKTDYRTALDEWNKFIYFTGGNDEINEYVNKISDAIKQDALKKIESKAEELFAEGVEKYNKKKWIQCIKCMEKLQKFVTDNKFSRTVEFYNKAKEYIDMSVLELEKMIKTEKKTKEVKEPETVIEEKHEIDEAGADKKYNEGLIFYAKGKYLEAERTWELTLRLNPNHQKAKISLSKLRKSGYLEE
jgi:hypothetical protein